jgi:4-amino-4-deoxy-L-arabinose transferase-like glycosyltransferase
MNPERWAVAGLGMAAGGLYAWGASGGAEHYYYAAAVRSMSDSWHAFAFGALDPTGAITVDKLPGMLWVQALCVRLFGFSPGVLLVPHAVAATGTVLALYGSVRHWAGRRPALLAGAAQALTPISYATARGTFPDTMLVCCLTVAAYLLTRAVGSRRTGWLVGAGLMVGLGFQMKMLAALVPLPAFVAALLVAKGPAARARLGRAALLTAVSLAACLPWPLLVAATPADERPWLDGTADNSVWQLVFGHNGLDRAGVGIAPFGGEPGPLRLLNPQLGGQIGWLLPLALAGIVAAVLTGRIKSEPHWALWGGWLALGAVAISAAGGVHPYYTTLLAPPIAALAAVGVPTLGTAGGHPGRYGPPLAVLATGGLAGMLAGRGGDVPTAVFVAVAAALAAVLLVTPARPASARPRRTAVAIALVAVLTGPAVWIARTPPLGAHTLQATNPVAGPYREEVVFGHLPPRVVMATLFGAPPSEPVTTELPGLDPDPALLAVLLRQPPWRRYLLATGDASSATPYLTAGYRVLPMGGFTADAPAPDVATLARLVADGQLRYVAVFPMPTGPAAARAGWVRTHCLPGPPGVSGPAGSRLYDCTARNHPHGLV